MRHSASASSGRFACIASIASRIDFGGKLGARELLLIVFRFSSDQVRIALQVGIKGHSKQELEAANKQISYMNNHDKLTGLPNSRLFSELVKTHIHKAKRRKEKLALLFLDLDDFKPINDAHGHDFGDHVLKLVADRLMSILRASDTCARIGGDEFVAIVSDFKNRDDIIIILEKIIKTIAQPMKISDIKCKLGVSIGVSIYPEDGVTIKDLLKSADTAMYCVKKKDKNKFRFFMA